MFCECDRHHGHILAIHETRALREVLVESIVHSTVDNAAVLSIR